MRRFHKLLGLLLALVIVLGVFAAAPLTAYAEESPYYASGSCGADENSDVEWFAFKDSSMAIFGNGPIRNYEYDAAKKISTAPWFGDDIEVIGYTLFSHKIAVEYGVTRIGDYSFYLSDTYPYKMFVQLYNVDIANTVTSIGKYAFYGQKLQEIIIPPSVTHIGENCFKNCASLNRIVYYGNPADLRWDSDAATDTEFSSTMTVHILDDYAGRVSEFNARFAYKHIEFEADIDNPYALEGEALDRNIAAYYGSVNSNVFGGAAPYIIVGRFNGSKKSVTHGSNGFASCVMINGEYYVLTDITTGELHKAITPSNYGGKMTGYESQALEGVTLKISHEYIGTNTVKIIYTLENKSGRTLNSVKVGGTGDIKIGADDKAEIHPLKEEDSDDQIGFYMRSGKEFDQSGSDYATLGFIGENVKIDNSLETSENNTYQDAHYFYGKVEANTANSAAGSQTVVLLPERIFNMNEAATAAGGRSYAEGEFTATEDSGMSYYWDVGDLETVSAGIQNSGTREYAVLFSVYGATDETAGSMITDLSETFHTVTWEDYDRSVLVKQVVKEGETPSYPGAEPFKASTAKFDYTFTGWSPAVGEITEDTVYTAQYSSTPRKFFKKHSLSLDGDIGVNYYVDVDVASLNVANVKSGAVKVKLVFDSYKDQEVIINGSTDYDTATGCFKAKRTVNAAEMAYDINTTAYFSNDNGATWTEYQDEHDVYSVREYGETVLNENSDFSVSYKTENPENYTQLKELMIKMLDYGAKAQVAFNRKTDDLANKNFRTYGVTYNMQNVTPEMIDTAVGSHNSNMREGLTGLDIEYAGSSLVFLSKTSLRHYYVFTDSHALDGISYSSNFTWHDKETGVEGYYGGYFEYTNIAASKLDEPQVFTIGSTDYSYAALHYAGLILENPERMDPADVLLAKATYWYNDAANRYFGE